MSWYQKGTHNYSVSTKGVSLKKGMIETLQMDFLTLDRLLTFFYSGETVFHG